MDPNKDALKPENKHQEPPRAPRKRRMQDVLPQVPRNTVRRLFDDNNNKSPNSIHSN